MPKKHRKDRKRKEVRLSWPGGEPLAEHPRAVTIKLNGVSQREFKRDVVPRLRKLGITKWKIKEV